MKSMNVAAFLLAALLPLTLHADGPKARFDLAGPKIEIRVTRGDRTLPIAEVPNLLPGDKLFLKADLPASQSNHLLMIVAFLRGTTNEPPDSWFTEIDTWDKKTAATGTTITVPADAQQAILFIAPQTGGDFKTLRSAVKGKPGLFIRADADLNEGSFEQQRIERYLTAMKAVPASDPKAIKDHSAKLAATLALKPNAACFKQPVDQQVQCLTQTSAPVLLSDGHGAGVAEALSSGPSSDFINSASLTQPAGGGLYSAYVGAVVDLVHIVSMLKTAQYQYIPGLSFPKGDTLNLKLNTPPSFHNPKTVIVIGLPAIQKAKLPPLVPQDPHFVGCLLNPKMVLPVQGAPLVFSSDFAHNLVLHVDHGGKPLDIAVTANAFDGGLEPAKDSPAPAASTPLTVTGTLHGQWGFDTFTGPAFTLQQVDGKAWKVVGDPQLIAGKDNKLTLEGDGTACVEKIELTGAKDKPIDVAFKPAAGPDAGKKDAITKDASKNDASKKDANKKDADKNDAVKDASKPADAAAPTNELALDVPLKSVDPGGYALAVKQFGAPAPDKVPLKAYTADIQLNDIAIHAGDRTTVLTGKGLTNVASVEIGGQSFTPTGEKNTDTTVHLAAKSAASPQDNSDGKVTLKDGRVMTINVNAQAARPGLKLLSLKAVAAAPDGALPIQLGNKDDIPLDGKLTFVVQTAAVFPQDQTIEVATRDGAIHTTLSLKKNTLVLQDEHTAIATLDPLKAFGESAFGKLEMRPVAANGTDGDWTPLGTLVRTPQITAVHCTTTAAPSCTIDGKNLFLAQSFGADQSFAKAASVPTGFADSTFTVPTPADGTTLYMKLRDDPSDIASVKLPTPVAAPAPAVTAPTAAPATPADAGATAPSATTSEATPATPPSDPQPAASAAPAPKS
jgi:hypothetical protein